MKMNSLLIATFTMAGLLSAGCAKKDQNPVDRAVESTKDALNVRDHEKLKDAGEDVKDAAKDLKEGVKDAADGKK